MSWRRISLAILLLPPATAWAQAIDLSSGGPVQVNAAGGIDWQQDAQTVTAHGDARAVRGNVTVTADQLTAHYRKKAGAPGTPAPTTTPTPVATPASDQPDDAAGTEVYRLDAVGHVHIFTPTDQAWGDKAVYDMDQSVLVLTGNNTLRLVTPQDVLTAQDSMEYWPNRHMAVARGHAVVVTSDARRLGADVLVAYTDPGAGNAQPPAATANPIQTVAANPATPPSDPVLASGKLQRVEAFGNVDVRTATETVHGDRGVYVPDTERAHVVGNVRITRGQNQLNGSAANVNMKSGVATLLSGQQQRVQGLIVPNDAQAAAAGPGSNARKPAKAAGGTK